MNSKEMPTDSINILVNDLFSLAKQEDWDRVDEEIIPNLSKCDGNKLARLLLEKIDDDDSNIRDAVATGLTVAEVNNEPLLDDVVDKMEEMANTDEEIFPAGRAILFLINLNKWNKKYEDRTGLSVDNFIDRAKNNNWKDELIENIPDLEEIF